MDEFYLGMRIRMARKQAGFSQEELAKSLNITLNSVNRYEKGHRKPDADILRRMVEILHCDPSWLLIGPPKAQGTGPPVIELGSKGPAWGICKQVERIVTEGDKKKIEAIKGMLTALDPGEIPLEGMGDGENAGTGAESDCA